MSKWKRAGKWMFVCDGSHYVVMLRRHEDGREKYSLYYGDSSDWARPGGKVFQIIDNDGCVSFRSYEVYNNVPVGHLDAAEAEYLRVLLNVRDMVDRNGKGKAIRLFSETAVSF